MTTFITGFPNALTGQPIDENSKPITGVYKNIQSGGGTVTTAGTPVQLISTSTEAKLLIIYNPNNSANLYIGGTAVSHSPVKGIALYPSQTYQLTITDLSNVWVDSDTNGATFTYNYEW